ncbi:MAG: hypothetical protein Q9197_003707 [Variospora fuerteventurae]
MRLSPVLSLRGLLVLLATISVASSLPQIPTVESLRSSLPGRPTALGAQRAREKIQGEGKHAHLYARRAEIFELEKRQQVNCTVPDALFFTECWQILNIHDYLTDSQTGWFSTTRICQNEAGSSGENAGNGCCTPGEPWSSCYLRLAIPKSNHDCTGANVNRCPEGMVNDIVVEDPVLVPYVRYTVKNIFGKQRRLRTSCIQAEKLIIRPAINNFFLTYYQGLVDAAGIVGNNIDQMVQEVCKIVQPPYGLQEVLLGLAVGLAFLGAPSFAIRLLSIEQTALKGSLQTLIISTQQAPNVGRVLYPMGDVSSQLIQMADLKNQLRNISGDIRSIIEGGVRLLMTDIEIFADFAGAGRGRYSGRNVTNTGEGTGLTVPSATDDLGLALNTYILTLAMSKNAWWASSHLGPYLTSAEVEAAFGCKYDTRLYLCLIYVPTTKDENTFEPIKDLAYFWSQFSLRVYLLSCDGPEEALSPLEMVEKIYTYDWAPLDIIFDGAFNCTAGGYAGSSAVTFNFDGTLDLACISQLPIYIGCGEMCPVALINETCPFKDQSQIKEGSCDDYFEGLG